MQPLVSIITINYNNAAGLKATVDSVIAQEFRDFEFVIIDGGSSDGSLAIIEENKSHFKQ
ncbi:glycosyltransferase, partial [Gilvibacter sp.]|uniref:glycosyltransferase n=1 Tax=Gilvibacter sp. TaxID=2729997 RepID=UPI0025B83E35